MTGRDLILYILSNTLENEPVFKDEKFIGFMTAGEVATKLGVGVTTISVLVALGQLEGYLIGDTLYIRADYKLPEETNLCTE